MPAALLCSVSPNRQEPCLPQTVGFSGSGRRPEHQGAGIRPLLARRVQEGPLFPAMAEILRGERPFSDKRSGMNSVRTGLLM